MCYPKETWLKKATWPGGELREGKMSSMENTCLLRKHTETRMAEGKEWQLRGKGQGVPCQFRKVHDQRQANLCQSTANPGMR